MQENAKVAEFSQISPMNGIAKASGRVRDLPRAPTPVTPWPAAVEPHPKLGGSSVRRTVGSAAKWLEKPMITDNFRELPRPFPQNVCPASEFCNPLVGLERRIPVEEIEGFKVNASSRNGVLTMVVRKSARAQRQAKRIAIYTR